MIKSVVTYKTTDQRFETLRDRRHKLNQLRAYTTNIPEEE